MASGMARGTNSDTVSRANAVKEAREEVVEVLL
jgi:hypothetical protein